jgi:hypothetical protein
MGVLGLWYLLPDQWSNIVSWIRFGDYGNERLTEEIELNTVEKVEQPDQPVSNPPEVKTL